MPLEVHGVKEILGLARPCVDSSEGKFSCVGIKTMDTTDTILISEREAWTFRDWPVR